MSYLRIFRQLSPFSRYSQFKILTLKIYVKVKQYNFRSDANRWQTFKSFHVIVYIFIFVKFRQVLSPHESNRHTDRRIHIQKRTSPQLKSEILQIFLKIGSRATRNGRNEAEQESNDAPRLRRRGTPHPRRFTRQPTGRRSTPTGENGRFGTTGEF